jgi:hypothetical protein
MKLKKTLATAAVVGAASGAALGFGSGLAQADATPTPEVTTVRNGISPGQLGQWLGIPPGQLGQLLGIPPGQWDLDWEDWDWDGNGSLTWP